MPRLGPDSNVSEFPHKCKIFYSDATETQGGFTIKAENWHDVNGSLSSALGIWGGGKSDLLVSTQHSANGLFDHYAVKASSTGKEVELRGDSIKNFQHTFFVGGPGEHGFRGRFGSNCEVDSSQDEQGTSGTFGGSGDIAKSLQEDIKVARAQLEELQSGWDLVMAIEDGTVGDWLERHNAARKAKGLAIIGSGTSGA